MHKNLNKKYYIAVGGYACRNYPYADLYIDFHADDEVSMHVPKIPREKIIVDGQNYLIFQERHLKLLQHSLDHLSDINLVLPDEFKLRLLMLPDKEHTTVIIITSFQGFYSMLMVPKIVWFLYENRIKYGINIQPVDPKIDERLAHSPNIQIGTPGVPTPPEYDFAISFNTVDKPVIDPFIKAIAREGWRCFYVDRWGENLGEDLYLDLHEIYARHSKYCLVMLSKNYFESEFTVTEYRAALERQQYTLKYIIPVLLDEEVEAPDEISHLAYLSLYEMTIQEMIDRLKSRMERDKRITTLL